MKTRATEAERIAEYERIADSPRVFCWRRPLQVWGHDDAGLPKLLEEREHQDVLIDRVTGARSMLQLLKDPRQIDQWHDVAAKTTTCHLRTPVTCTTTQLRPLLDERSKVIFVFGGNQSGKSSIGGLWLGTRIAKRRGLYMWLAPTQEKTSVGVEKLTETTEFSPSVIPKELIAYIPDSPKAERQYILLVDGTKIKLLYCSRKGQNIKGLTGVIAGVMDEAADVQWEINYTIAVARFARAGGQLLVPTTPVVPSWLQDVDRVTRTYEEVDTLREMGEVTPANVKTYFSMEQNPWITPEAFAETVEAQGGPDSPKAQRESFGRWVAEGTRLWRHFRRTSRVEEGQHMASHVVEWGRRDVSIYGFTDITSLVGQDVFRGFTDQKDHEWLGGVDFNFNPYSVALVKVVVPHGADQRDPANWHLYVDDEVTKQARSTLEFGEWFTMKAGAFFGRGLPGNAFANVHAICDGEGFYKNRDRRLNASADAEELRKCGIVVKAPKYLNGNELNPPRKVRIGFANELLFRNRILVNAQRCPSLISALDNEVDDGSGDTRKGKNDKRDRMSGITDALTYLAYAVLWNRKPVKPIEIGKASGW